MRRLGLGSAAFSMQEAAAGSAPSRRDGGGGPAGGLGGEALPIGSLGDRAGGSMLFEILAEN
ncbi:MAG: hypothetical protein JW986_05270 [Methanotrichaceae archaeon]|nr:hypothetical protein [Methanotrichaceae archaeon]